MQNEAPEVENKRFSLALLGKGRLHGEDDAVSMRPYSSSLICSKAGSEVFRLSRVEFYRMFKSNSDCWAKAMKFAQEKENKLIRRCKSYLYTSKDCVE